ncbi:SIMPL domain-containing protein [Caldimonas tepidiphila]|uniref:SIMPL domain-containing protein n=1 Tax=Caldimonas tepidiphila TaxID=2315841 RepID=UPI000E5B8560|nr:SIMPL domain-containing protein [Caldimonas tepidiphila]
MPHHAFRAPALALAGLLLGGPVLAGPAEPLNVVNFSAAATVEVAQDLLTITLGTTREGAEPAAVQSALRQAVEAALAEARRAAQPDAMEVRTGNFSLSPRYGNQGRITGWHGSAEVVLEGRDWARITQTAGRVQTMTVSQVAQGLSREQREKHEAEAGAQAIERFRVLAAGYARQFGFSGYTLREVTVASGEAPPPMFPKMEMQARSMSMADAPVPVAAGKGLVTVTVGGSVQLTR